MNKQIKMFSLVFIILVSFSCNNLQEKFENKAKEIRETADKKIDESMNKADSTLRGLDSTIQKKIDRHLEKADTLLNRLNEKIN